jgi:RNA polymerase sigma factor (sigma-70 family)
MSTERRTPATSEAAHALRLRAAFEKGRAAHPLLALGPDSFARRALAAAHVRLRRAGALPERNRVEEVLRETDGADLFLAAACDEGVAGAWESLTETYVPRIVGLLRSRGASEDEAREIAEQLPGEAYEPPADGTARTRIGTYTGWGSLFGWLAALALRRLADRRRAPDRRRDEVGRGRSPGRDPDPAEALAGAETSSSLREGLEDAWSELGAKERLVLVLKYRDGLPQTSIAQALGVGPPRVSRLVAAATDKVRAAVRRRLPASEAGDPDRVWRALRDAVGRHLASAAPRIEPLNPREDRP